MLTPEYLLSISEGAEEIAEYLHADIMNRIIERIMIRLNRGEEYLLTSLDKWQLEVIQRCIELWTNPNDIVFDPFGGIGSTPYVALTLGRRAVSSELKESYFLQMKGNVEEALHNGIMDCPVGQMSIEDFLEASSQ